MLACSWQGRPEKGDSIIGSKDLLYLIILANNIILNGTEREAECINFLGELDY